MSGDKDDPFGLGSDAGRTRIRTVRRGAGAQREPAPVGPTPLAAAPQSDGSVRLREARANDNPLVNAYSPLLGLAPELERARAPDNPDVMQARLLDNLTYARDSAIAAGVTLTRADQGAWFVAALLDDIALNTPWGGASGWPRMPLVVALYGDVDAGVRFFSHADELMRHPERDPELLELAYLCVGLGFRGKHRVEGGRGEAALTQLRAQMARMLRDRDTQDKPLSPHWQGIVAEDERRGFVMPLWSVALIALALIVAIYVSLSIRLSNRGEQLFTLASVLPPPERAEIFRPVIETGPSDPTPIEPFILELRPLLIAAAPAETAGALSVKEDVSIALAAVQGNDPEVFRSAKADLNGEYDALIRAIAGVIVENIDFIGQVRVVGHTDSVPVQRSNPFRSNQGLSEARARTIADLLIAAGVPAEIVAAEGRAATEPVADNATREGRAQNRRVEIVLQKKV